MTATQPATAYRTSVLSPLVTASFGFVVYALAMISGETFEINMDGRLDHPHPDTPWEAVSAHTAELAVGLLAVAIAVWAGRWAWSGPGPRLGRTALILAVIGAVAFPIFWTGWPSIFGAVAVGLALESRRRVGGLGRGTGTALVLGALAFLAGAVTCLLG